MGQVAKIFVQLSVLQLIIALQDSLPGILSGDYLPSLWLKMKNATWKFQKLQNYLSCIAYCGQAGPGVNHSTMLCLKMPKHSIRPVRQNLHWRWGACIEDWGGEESGTGQVWRWGRESTGLAWRCEGGGGRRGHRARLKMGAREHRASLKMGEPSGLTLTSVKIHYCILGSGRGRPSAPVTVLPP